MMLDDPLRALDLLIMRRILFILIVFCCYYM